MYKKLALAVLAALFMSCCIGFGALVSAGTNLYSFDLFEYKSAYGEANAAVPETTGISEARRGLRVCASESGASADYQSEVSGVFDIEFMPYSSVSYGGSVYETDLYSNAYQDINSMSLVFTDSKDENKSFSVKLNGGANGNNVTVNASIIYGETQAGIYYYNDSAASGSTTGYNGNAVYTFLYGCSFSNVAVANGMYAAKNVRPIRIIFDPAEMKVYGYNYGYNAYTAQPRLIWDFSSEVVDGRNVGFMLESFDSYRVKIVFDDIKAGAAGNIVIYSVNGQSLSNTVTQNDFGPTSYIGGIEDAALGEKIGIPIPVSYDVYYGKIPFAGLVKAIDPTGSVCKIENAEESADDFYAYTADAELICEKEGEYTLIYKAVDPDGLFGCEYAVKFQVCDFSEPIFFGMPADRYFGINDLLEVETAGWTVNGKTIEAEYKVYGPRNELLSEPYILSQEGRYTVTFIGENGSETLTESYYIYVLNSSAGLFEGTNGAVIRYGNSGLHEDLNGMIAEAYVSNTTISYTVPVRITDKSKDDTLVSLMALPERFGTASMGQISVKLQDVADAENYVTVIIGAGNEPDTSVIRAAAADQTFSGLNNNGVIESFSGGGTPILHSFTGIARYKDICSQLIDIRFDYAEKRIYAGDKLVCDLDDSGHFSQIWDGFTSEEILISVTMRDISAEKCSLLFVQIDGNEFIDGYYREYVAPSLKPAFDENDIPKAIVGKPYEILPVEIIGKGDEKTTLKVEVYDEAGNPMPLTGNAFTPQEEGDYILKYIVTNAMGNSSDAEFTVTAENTLDKLEIDPVGPIVENAYVGELIYLPQAAVSGGSGGYTMKITAKGKSTQTEYAITDYILKALVADEYTIVYEVKDYIGEKAAYETEINIKLSDAPIFDAFPEMPSVIISDVPSKLPFVTAKDYTDGEKDAAVEVTVSVDGSETITVGSEMTFTASIEKASATARITYIAKGGRGTTERYFDVPVINLRDENGYLDLTRYFLTENIDEIEACDDYISFNVSSGAEISFIKPVYAHGFELMFDIPASANNLEKFTLTLTDTVDKSKQVVFEIVKGGFADSVTTVNINYMQSITIAGNFYDAVRHMRIAYDNEDFSIKDASGLTVGNIKSYADGNLFRGFSDTIDFSLSFGTVSGAAQFQLYTVGNQQFMENDDDYTRPVVILESELQRSLERGGTLVVPRAKAYDVLGFDTEISVSVSCGDNVLLTGASCSETHSVKLDAYGEYNVLYRATDENGNVNNYLLVVNVRDNVPPQIEVDTKEKVIWAGESFKIPEANVTDDVAVEKTYVFVIDTSNNMIDVTGQKSFQTTVKGIYTLRYVAVDTAGNYRITDVVIKAAEAKQ